MGLKWCKRCGQTTERRTSGRCAPCARSNVRRWYSAHAELAREAARKRYWANPEAHREQRRQRRDINTPERSEYQRRYREKNRDLFKKADRQRNGWAPGEHEKAEASLPFVTACACCGSASPRTRKGWSADHSHETGAFRGHICQPCNLQIGSTERYGLMPSPQVAVYLALTSSGHARWNHVRN